MLRFIESVVLFVPDVDAAAAWYAEIFGTKVHHENALYAFIRAPGVFIGFHPVDMKCPGGVGGTTAYWQVDDMDTALAFLQQRGARLHRGPGLTSCGAGAAMLIDPFGCTIGLNAATAQSHAALDDMSAESTPP
jgi:predicted enzyme related to lactoylglutathione lyase